MRHRNHFTSFQMLNVTCLNTFRHDLIGIHKYFTRWLIRTIIRKRNTEAPPLTPPLTSMPRKQATLRIGSYDFIRISHFVKYIHIPVRLYFRIFQLFVCSLIPLKNVNNCGSLTFLCLFKQPNHTLHNIHIKLRLQGLDSI